MAASERELSDAYRAGFNRKPLPDALAGDSAARSLHAQGEDDRDAGRPRDEHMWNLGRETSGDAPHTATKSGGKRSSAKPSASAPAAKKRTGRTRRTGQFSTLGQRGRDLFSRPATLGGDGGGLLLAVFAYPIVLAILQHGPAGATDWLKAKFLNIDTHPGAGSTGPKRHTGNPAGGGKKPRHE